MPTRGRREDGEYYFFLDFLSVAFGRAFGVALGLGFGVALGLVFGFVFFAIIYSL